MNSELPRPAALVPDERTLDVHRTSQSSPPPYMNMPPPGTPQLHFYAPSAQGMAFPFASVRPEMFFPLYCPCCQKSMKKKCRKLRRDNIKMIPPPIGYPLHLWISCYYDEYKRRKRISRERRDGASEYTDPQRRSTSEPDSFYQATQNSSSCCTPQSTRLDRPPAPAPDG
eukprot:TRINITY_DN13919_c2_g1_i1.p1 TRINITY_DN13919_c2_g1~~TRINITY_DN13919_c2_g1_i1.p1  ORF type:complete len:170 (+),score=11.23 TRINITY_DN13919_c2_g1_i1:111-620(+)